MSLDLREKLPDKTRLFFRLGGYLFIILLLEAIVRGLHIKRAVFASPSAVVSAFPEMVRDWKLFENIWHSLVINWLGNIEAAAIAIPLGFFIALDDRMRAIFEQPITMMRYAPPPIFAGIFIAVIGIYTNMQVQFLAFATVLFLVPQVVTRVDEVPLVYDQTAITLGASKWQRITKVFIPGALPQIMIDFLTLFAISWTYITTIEIVNMSMGGLGTLAFQAGRWKSRVDIVLAAALIIVLYGMLQDTLGNLTLRKVFRHKFLKGGK